MTYSKIIGTGAYLPEKVLTNADLEKMVDTSDEWIVQRTGIRKRHLCAPGETASKMAEHAARDALSSANIDKSEIDLIIIATTTPDKVLPSTACLLQDALGIPAIPAFDLSAACAGFIYAMSVADQFIKAGGAKTVLLVGSEAMSSITDWEDRNTCVLFGDGAGAVILQASEEPGILSTHIHADGRYKDALHVPSGLPGQAKDNAKPYVNMAGKEVFKVAVNYLGEVVDETLAANKMQQDDIDWLIPHQANIRIIQATAKKLNLPIERVILTIQDQGNTSAASIPLALDIGIKQGKIKRGENLLLEGIGGGFAWGSALVKY